MWVVLVTLADALVVPAGVLALAVAHDVTESRLDKLLLQILWEDYLETWRGGGERK